MTSFLLTAAARLSGSLESCKARVIRGHIDYIEGNAANHIKELMAAVVGRILESDRGGDRLGAWYVLDACLKSKTVQSAACTEVIPWMTNLIRYRMEICDEELSPKYVHLIGSWRKMIEHSLYREWYHAAEDARRHPDFQNMHDVPNCLQVPVELRRNLRRLRGGWTLERAQNVFDEHDLNYGDGTVSACVDKLRAEGGDAISLQEIQGAVSFFDHIGYCGLCRGVGHKRSQCIQQICARCVKSGHSVDTCTRPKDKCLFCNRSGEHTCREHAVCARHALQRLALPWPRYVSQQRFLLDAVVERYRSVFFRKASTPIVFDEIAMILDSVETLRGCKMPVECRDAVRYLATIPDAVVSDLMSSNAAVEGLSTNLRHVGRGAKVHRLHKSIDALNEYFDHFGLTNAQQHALHDFHSWHLFRCYADSHFKTYLDEHIDFLSHQAAVDATKVRDVVRVVSDMHNVCSSCLQVGHLTHDCPLNVNGELSCDQRLALKVLQQYDWHNITETDVTFWKTKIDLKKGSLSNFEHSQLHLAVQIITGHATRPPHCNDCQVFGHSDRTCRKRAEATLHQHNVSVTEVNLYPSVVKDKIHHVKKNSHRDGTALGDAADLLDTGRCSDMMTDAAELLRKLKIRVHTAQYFPDAILSIVGQRGPNAFNTSSSSSPTSTTTSLDVKYAISVVTSERFPKLCFACGVMDHQIDTCHNVPTIMEGLRKYAVELGSRHRDLLERCLRQDISLSTETYTSKSIRATVFELFSLVKLFEPTLLSSRVGLKNILEVEKAVVSIERHAIPLGDVLAGVEGVAEFEAELKKEDEREGEVLSNAIKTVRQNKVPLCVACNEVGHYTRDCAHNDRRAREEAQEQAEAALAQHNVAPLSCIRCPYDVVALSARLDAGGHKRPAEDVREAARVICDTVPDFVSVQLHDALATLQAAFVAPEEILLSPHLSLLAVPTSQRKILTAAGMIYNASLHMDSYAAATLILAIFGHLKPYPAAPTASMDTLIEDAERSLFRDKLSLSRPFTLSARALRVLRRIRDEEEAEPTRKLRRR